MDNDDGLIVYQIGRELVKEKTSLLGVRVSRFQVEILAGREYLGGVVVLRFERGGIGPPVCSVDLVVGAL